MENNKTYLTNGRLTIETIIILFDVVACHIINAYMPKAKFFLFISIYIYNWKGGRGELVNRFK